MAWLILLAVVALPVVEILLFMESARLIGALPTIAMAILAAMAGLALVRRQGLATLLRIHTQLGRGDLPFGDAFDAVCLAACGALLLLPGFLTDVMALLLLVPPLRALLRSWLASRLAVSIRRPSAVIDAEYRILDHPPSRHRDEP
jgi:UPF0716 protein FxsA